MLGHQRRQRVEVVVEGGQPFAGLGDQDQMVGPGVGHLDRIVRIEIVPGPAQRVEGPGDQRRSASADMRRDAGQLGDQAPVGRLVLMLTKPTGVWKIRSSAGLRSTIATAEAIVA